MDLYNLVVSAKLTKGGGGGDVSVDPLSVTENGTYTADVGHAYSPVTVSVPGIVPSGTSSITANGIYDITDFASVDVNVSGGGGDHDVEDAIIQRTISGAYTNSRVTEIGGAAFRECSALTSVVFQNVIRIDGAAFQYCDSLEYACFPNLQSIYNSAFFKCSKLMSVVLPGSTIVILRDGYAFSKTPMEDSSYTGSYGSIYVPASLVSIYKNAMNWTRLDSRITAYEGE